MITFKTFDNENDSTVSIAEVDNDNDAVPVALIEEENADNSDINFLANLNLIVSNINDNNNNTTTENYIEERFQTQCEVELKLY